MDEDYKSLLIMNEALDADITFYVYSKWDIICWLSYTSKIIKPGEKYYHRSKSGFQYKIVARFNLQNKRKTKTVVEVEKWKEEKAIKVLDSLDVIEGKLDGSCLENQICLRDPNKNDVASYDGGRDLYGILNLDKKKVRKMSQEEQNETIRRAYLRRIQRCHPDRHYGDEEIAREVIMAYDVLSDPEKRATYNNVTDYDKGWLSVSRFKAIFWPDCYTEKQKSEYRKRIAKLALSAGLAIGGFALGICTGGLAAPALVAVMGVVGNGLLGTGFLSLPETTTREAVADGCNTKKWLGKAAIGFVGGAAAGGATVGIATAVTGIGSAPLRSAAVSVGRRAALKASTGATEGFIGKLTSDAGRKLVDGEDVTWDQVLRNAMSGAGLGSFAGSIRGVSKIL